MSTTLETRGPALGNLSRDILCLLWTRRSLTSRHVANIFNIGHEAVMVQKHIDGLARKGLIAYLRDPQGWCILDTDATRAALRRPARDDGWARLLSNGTVQDECTNTYAAALAMAEKPAPSAGLRVPTLMSAAELAAHADAARQASKRTRNTQPITPEPEPPEHMPQLTGERARMAYGALPLASGIVIRAGALDALRLQSRRIAPGADPAAFLGLRD